MGAAAFNAWCGIARFAIEPDEDGRDVASKTKQ